MRWRQAAISVGVILLLLSFSLDRMLGQWNPFNPVNRVNQQPDGVVFAMQKGTLQVTICSDSIARIIYSADGNLGWNIRVEPSQSLHKSYRSGRATVGLGQRAVKSQSGYLGSLIRRTWSLWTSLSF